MGFPGLHKNLSGSVLIVDEIPGRITGNDEEPPGRILHMDQLGNTLWESFDFKMPYDAVPLEDETYLVNIIRDKAVWHVNRKGERLNRILVGGYPCSTQLLQGGDILVSGWDYHLPGFVRRFNDQGRITWCCEGLKWPWKAELLKSGNVLIADAGRRHVIEVDENGTMVWEIGNLGPENPKLWDALGPVYCQRLENGHTLISVRGHSQVIEVTNAGDIIWEIGSDMLCNQYAAVRLKNGNTLIADSGNFRMIEVSPEKKIVWELSGLGYPAKGYRF